MCANSSLFAQNEILCLPQFELSSVLWRLEASVAEVRSRSFVWLLRSWFHSRFFYYKWDSEEANILVMLFGYLRNANIREKQHSLCDSLVCLKEGSLEKAEAMEACWFSFQCRKESVAWRVTHMKIISRNHFWTATCPHFFISNNTEQEDGWVFLLLGCSSYWISV